LAGIGRDDDLWTKMCPLDPKKHSTSIFSYLLDFKAYLKKIEKNRFLTLDFFGRRHAKIEKYRFGYKKA